MLTRGLALVAILLAQSASAQTAVPSARAALRDLESHAEWRGVFDSDRERPTLVLLVSPT